MTLDTTGRRAFGDQTAHHEFLLAGCLVLATTVWLAAFTPAYQHWDALVYAFRAQSGQLVPSLYSHHALSNLLFYGLSRALVRLGLVGDSVAAFQTANAVFGGLASALLYALARSWGHRRLTAVGLAVLLTGSYGFWHYAGTADLYTWIILVTLLFWWSASRAWMQPTSARFVVAGTLAAAAILSWQPNGWLAALFGAAYVLAARHERRSIAGRVLLYGGSGVVLVVGGHLLLGWLAGARTWSEYMTWFVGYFANDNYSGLLSWTTWPAVSAAAQRAVLVPPYTSWPYRLVWLGAWAGVAFLAIATLWEGLRRRGAPRSLVLLNLGWMSGLAAASWWFDPRSPKFWLVIWLGVVLMATVGLAGRGRTRSGRWSLDTLIVAPLAAGLFTFNLMVGILPEHRLTNYQVRAALVWRENTQPHDLLVVGPDFRTYLDYYGDRHQVICPECAFEAVVVADRSSAAEWVAQALATARSDGATVYRAHNVCQLGEDSLTGWCSAEMLAVLDSNAWVPAFEVFDGRESHPVLRAETR